MNRNELPLHLVYLSDEQLRLLFELFAPRL